MRCLLEVQKPSARTPVLPDPDTCYPLELAVKNRYLTGLKKLLKILLFSFLFFLIEAF